MFLKDRGQNGDIYRSFLGLTQESSSIAVVLPQKAEEQEETYEQAPTEGNADVITVCQPVWHVLASFLGHKWSV